MQPAPATCGDPRLSSRRVTAQIARAHAAYFLTNGRSKFWGAGFHVEKLINALREAELSLGRRRAAAPPVLVDVGAAPYNTIGGDISHVLTMASLWNESSAMILGFEPGVHPFSRLKDFIGKAVGRPARDCGTDCADDAGQTANVASSDGQPWVVLRNTPLSNTERTVQIANSPGAGDNTASLERNYGVASDRGREVRAVTLDNELRRRGLDGREVLLLKVDVEGHELAVLRGADKAIGEGRVPFILLEYGDKMSPAIWGAMKRRNDATPAAPTPALLEGPSLFRLQRWADGRGYDTYLLGEGDGGRPVLVGATGRYWRDSLEVCRDKGQKWSRDGRRWENFSAWDPSWSAVCWYDVLLVLRKPLEPQLRQLLLERTSLPPRFCRQLSDGWYPTWVDAPTPERLCCSVQNLKQTDVCGTFVACAGSENNPPLRGLRHVRGLRRAR